MDTLLIKLNRKLKIWMWKNHWIFFVSLTLIDLIHQM